MPNSTQSTAPAAESTRSGGFWVSEATSTAPARRAVPSKLAVLRSRVAERVADTGRHHFGVHAQQVTVAQLKGKAVDA